MNLNGRLSFTGNVHGSMGAQLVADVEANPAGAPSQTLVSIRVGDVIYSIPSGGGGGGTSDYNALNNKPKVNNVTLSGDLTLADLGIQPAISFPGDASKYLDGNGSFSTPAAGVVDYSTNKTAISEKWINGETIYRQVFSNLSISVQSGGTWAYTGVRPVGVTQLIRATLIGQGNIWFGAVFMYADEIIISTPYSFTLNQLILEWI